MNNKELYDIFIAYVALSLAVAIAFGFNSSNLIFSFLFVGTSFIIHELSHRTLAIYYGAKAEFRKFDKGLLIMLIFSFAGFLFAMPGAVFIRGRLSKFKNAMISLAGPLSNLFLGLIFLFINLFFSNYYLMLAYKINFFLAFFNMLPFFPLDGSKVFYWNKFVWLIVQITSLILLFI